MNQSPEALDDIEAIVRRKLRIALYDRIRVFGLLACLAAYTLCTLDGGDVAPFCISAAVLLLTAFSLLLPSAATYRIGLPVWLLLAMAAYGVIQTLFFPHKIVYAGWTAVLFWFTAACLALLGSQVAQNNTHARLFRIGFAVFGSAICLLELLEQASRTTLYFWWLPSKTGTVYGTFAYWNNFAQFCEICLPVTLWIAFRKRDPDIRFVFLPALQIGAVATSGSRAGSALVLLELIAILSLLYLRNRNRSFLYAAATTVVLSAVFVYSAGISEVVHKLQAKDQLSVRRQINESTWAMIQQHPLTGWGLNSYVSVYPMSARFDAGTYVNRAHNDWLQWTAEGGVFFTTLMLSAALWSVRPALRSIWGVGLLAVCLHALVDYPFARLGVCGWYFALLGMLVFAKDPTHSAVPGKRVRRQSRHRSASIGEQ